MTAFEFSDIIPFTHTESPASLCAIEYSPTYKSTTELLHSLIEKNEISERAFALTYNVINQNPFNVTAWAYRAKLLQDSNELNENWDWLDQISTAVSKNYQIWHFRQLLLQIDRYNTEAQYLSEIDLVQMIIQKDKKHYHVWTHYKFLMDEIQANAQVVTRQKSLKKALEFTLELIEFDVYNNSAWTFRFHLIQKFAEIEYQKKEIDIVTQAYQKAPENESILAYIEGLQDADIIVFDVYK